MENIHSFTSKDWTIEPPSRQDLRDIEKALIRDGFDRVFSVPDFVATPPAKRVALLENFNYLKNKLNKFFISTNGERVLLNHIYPEVKVSNPLGKLVIISGPSGVGKDTIIQKFLEKNPHIDRVVTATTRQARPGEQAGISYHFLSTEDFNFLFGAKLLMDRFDFVASSYGTPITEMRKRERGDVVVNAAPETKEKYLKIIEDVKLIVIMPEGEDESKREGEIYKRLVRRGTETEEQIRSRIEQDRVNFANWDNLADFTVVSKNGDVSNCVAEIEAIIKNN